MRGRILAFADRTPPSEIQLWNIGDNPTDYGVHIWSPRSIREVVGRYQERGNPIVIDIEHNGAGAKGSPDVEGDTGGYARLELRDGAPWLVFEWSDIAKEQIATGQRRFLSPEYDTDKTTGEIVCLWRVSLVADPGTHHARVLASALNIKGTTSMHPMLLAALKAAMAAEDPKASISALLEELEKSGGAGDPDAVSADADATPAEVAASESPSEEGAPRPYAEGSGTGQSKDGEQVAAGDDAAGSADKDKVAAAAPARREPPPMPRIPAKVTVRAAGEASSTAQAAAAGPSPQDAIDRADDLERDMLLREEGDRLGETIRVWATSQPLRVVKSLVDAAPKRLAPPSQVHATRGMPANGISGTGQPIRHHLSGEARRDFDRVWGKTKLEPIGPMRTRDGNLRIVAGSPGEFREQERQRVSANRPAATAERK